MAYLAGLILVGLFFLALHYFTELTHSQKTLVSALILAIILSAIGFNKYSNNQRDKMLNTIIDFNQGKSITCNGIKIDNKNFTLSIGTYTFIGKKNTPNYSQMISASTCE